jgi:predicted metal-dependent enzyme (double-stranded beta helix superfamily)
MCDTGYSIRELAADLRELTRKGLDEEAMARAVPDLAKRLVLMKHNWLHPYMCVPNREPGADAATHRLHEEPDHSLAVFVVTWLPGDETPPHDHGTWAVIAGLDGHETNHWWKRTDDGSIPGFANVERSGHERIDSGTIIAMPGRAIHSLHNDSDAVSVTLHVYGRNVNYTDRHKYDPARHTFAPYRFGGTTAASRQGGQP